MLFNCDLCGKEFKADLGRFKNKKHKFCSRECSSNFAKAKPNYTCPICKKEIHVKAYKLKNMKMPVTCSRECNSKIRSIYFSGEQNHQWGLRGTKNSSFIYGGVLKKNHRNYYWKQWMPEHPNADSSGRILRHRRVVEENSHLFNPEYFYDSEFGKVLYTKYDVHHINEITTDNRVSNLLIVTKSEHRREHSKNKHIVRDKLGRIIGVVKSGELLESPEEGNQQPSVVKDIEVATKVQRLDGEESTNNPSTSARHTLIGKLKLHELPCVLFPEIKTKYDDIVRATEITLQETVEPQDKELVG